MPEAQKFIYLEDISVGQKFTAGSMTVTEESIIAFARQFDPQDFHTDPVKAKDTVFGGLVASGWHTASMSMRMILDATPKMKGGMIGRQVEKIGWPMPVRAGDVLSIEVEIMELRPSATNPSRGTIRTKNTTFNQKHEIVQEMEAIIFIPRRSVS